MQFKRKNKRYKVMKMKPRGRAVLKMNTYKAQDTS